MSEQIRVDLVVLGEGDTRMWQLGDCYVVPETIESVISTVQTILTSNDNGFVLFLHASLQVQELTVQSLIGSNSGVTALYDDRTSNKYWAPLSSEMISPGIYFNLKTSDEGFSIWNMSLHCFLIKKEILRQVGFLNERFLSIHGAMVEWIHRMLYAGVLLTREKLVIGNTRSFSTPIVPIEDELRFVKHRFGRKWFLWSLVRYAMQGRLRLDKLIGVYKKINLESVVTKSRIDHSNWRDTTLRNEEFKISIIVPTIERYSYLVTVLNQLKDQVILPHEVIVIDQTPKEFRKEELFTAHNEIGLRYFTMDKAGQCRSRNLGLSKSTGDYVLFIDDDVEVKPELLTDHLKCLQYFHADVSCGVCDEPGAGPAPIDYTFIRLSDVFPTNNLMVKRSVLQKSGLFDMAYDHGQRADGDLGARIYKTGARLILNPEIRVLHHRAPRGGLRKHNVRKVTYSSSRKFITHFRMPHITELYLNKIHFSVREQREYIILSLLGMFSIQGSSLKRILKMLYAAIMLPVVAYKIFRRNVKAKEMLKVFPQIPTLEKLPPGTSITIK